MERNTEKEPILTDDKLIMVFLNGLKWLVAGIFTLIGLAMVGKTVEIVTRPPKYDD